MMHWAAAGMLLCIPGFALGASGQTVEIKVAEGQSSFAIENAAVTDLSGIVWLGNDSFAAVSDKRNVIQLLTLKIDGATGTITSGQFDEAKEVPTKVHDFEGLAWVSAEKAFYVSAEAGNSVVRFTPGSVGVRSLPVPAIFAKARPNLSLESLTWNDTERNFWLANEEALQPDGPVSSPKAGTIVRLQKLDAKFRPLAQFAWRTEPTAFRYGHAGGGVSDLCLLPAGHLLVLERGFSGVGLHLRLFLADFAGATDTTRLSALAQADFVCARKTLLFEQMTGFINFEGLTLGPPLKDGWRSLILVADSNGTATHTFLALQLRVAPR